MAQGSRGAERRKPGPSIESPPETPGPWSSDDDDVAVAKHGVPRERCLDDEELDGPTVVSTTDEPAASPAAAAAAAAAAGYGRGRIMSYVHRLPLHVFGVGRSSDRTGPVETGASSEARGAWDSTERRRRRESKRPMAGVVAESAGGSSIFGSEQDLLKRVSSVPGNLLLFRAHLTEPLMHPEFRAPPRYTRCQSVQLPANEPDDTPIYGYALLTLTSVLFISSMYSLVVSKFMPYTGIAFLDTVKDDRYFCLLMPITGLSFGFAVFWNWLGMKFFRHN
ncbi:hypothetical protein LPJ61_000532 [Coemansia biformis]|uniref:Uncharacterized protein n=1 Tax=Coemansia biformis TaxID=1286918 RepID=A0A9W7YI60_9FUNG|nr:hypothetical protein LPJ61_000532 [Coemansia biformis]